MPLRIVSGQSHRREKIPAGFDPAGNRYSVPSFVAPAHKQDDSYSDKQRKDI